VTRASRDLGPYFRDAAARVALHDTRMCVHPPHAYLIGNYIALENGIAPIVELFASRKL